MCVHCVVDGGQDFRAKSLGPFNFRIGDWSEKNRNFKGPRGEGTPSPWIMIWITGVGGIGLDLLDHSTDPRGTFLKFNLTISAVGKSDVKSSL